MVIFYLVDEAHLASAGQPTTNVIQTEKDSVLQSKNV